MKHIQVQNSNHMCVLDIGSNITTEMKGKKIRYMHSLHIREFGALNSMNIRTSLFVVYAFPMQSHSSFLMFSMDPTEYIHWFLVFMLPRGPFQCFKKKLHDKFIVYNALTM